MGVTDTNYSALYVLAYANTSIKGTGIGQRTLVKLLDDYITNFNAMLTKLDSDGGVTDTNYNSTLAITDNVNNIAADPIKNTGVFQGAVVTLFGTIRTKFNALLTKLDADGGVTDTDYSSLWALAAIDANQISQGGVNQGAFYTRLNLIKTNFNAVLTKLDADV